MKRRRRPYLEPEARPVYHQRPVEFELTPDGYLRQLGKVVGEPPVVLESPPAHALGTRPADAEAARRFQQIAESPVQIVPINPSV